MGTNSSERVNRARAIATPASTRCFTWNARLRPAPSRRRPAGGRLGLWRWKAMRKPPARGRRGFSFADHRRRERSASVQGEGSPGAADRVLQEAFFSRQSAARPRAGSSSASELRRWCEHQPSLPRHPPSSEAVSHRPRRRGGPARDGSRASPCQRNARDDAIGSSNRHHRRAITKGTPAARPVSRGTRRRPSERGTAHGRTTSQSRGRLPAGRRTSGARPAADGAH